MALPDPSSTSVRAHPIAPAGTAILIYESPEVRGSWQDALYLNKYVQKIIYKTIISHQLSLISFIFELMEPYHALYFTMRAPSSPLSYLSPIVLYVQLFQPALLAPWL
jgi:hypothetical protein